MKTITLTVTVEIDGSQAAELAQGLANDAQAGDLDQALLNLLRGHTARLDDPRDWRIVAVRAFTAGGTE